MSGNERTDGAIAGGVEGLADNGVHTILVTSSTHGEGRSSVVARVGRALSSGGGTSVLVVEADQASPATHRAFGVTGSRGLSDLLEEVYWTDLARENPDQFGLGDWIEILRAQRRSGDLEVKEDGERHVVKVVKGTIHSVSSDQERAKRRLGEILLDRERISAKQRDDALRIHEGTGRSFGDVIRSLRWVSDEDLTEALRIQLVDRFAALMAMRQPECRFLEVAEAHLPATGGRSTAVGTDLVDRALLGPMRRYLRRPFLTSQIPSYVSDTSLENLKVLTSGRRDVDLLAPRFLRPFDLLIQHMAQIFDVVLIDAPPVSRVGLTGALAGLVDGVVMVVKANGIRMDDARRAVDELKRSGANVLGVILNQTEGPGEPVPSSEELLSHGSTAAY
jgi:Mrp family chromosome partitioning ATPase